MPPGFPTVGTPLTPFLTDGALLGLCSASAVSSFLPVLRLGLVNPEGYIAFPLFPHLSDIPPACGWRRANDTCGPRVTAQREVGRPRRRWKRGADQTGLEPCKDRPTGVYVEPESELKMEIPVKCRSSRHIAATFSADRQSTETD